MKQVAACFTVVGKLFVIRIELTSAAAGEGEENGEREEEVFHGFVLNRIPNIEYRIYESPIP